MKTFLSSLGVATIAAVVTGGTLAYADWLGYRGPTQNGTTGEVRWNPAAVASPKTLWKVSVGIGTSSVTVSGGRAYTMGNVDGKDVIYALDAATGQEVWRYSYPMSVDPKMFEGGPRSTPVLDGERLYAVSHQGDFFCLEAATGKKLWYHHFFQEFQGQRPDWGYAGSPLVRGNVVYVDVGGAEASTVAFEKTTGKVLWKSGGDQGGYATPVAARLGGQETLVVFKKDAVVGLELANGAELWRTPWKTSYDVNAATPLALANDRLFVSSGYNTGGALFQIGNHAATQVWKNKNLRSQLNSAVTLGDCVYGIDGDVGGGRLVCLSLADGEKKWEERSVRGGALVLSGGKLIVLTEKGELVVCEASPTGFKALGRAQIFAKERCWAQPTLDAGRLYLRSNEGTLICLEMR